MTFVLNDRVKQIISSTGTGTLTLGGTPSGFVSFTDGVGDGNQTYYAIENLPQWEVGIGTYSSGTLTRDTVLGSSNGGSRIDIAVGPTPSTVFCNYPAGKSVVLDETDFIVSTSPDYQGIRFQTTQITAYKSERPYRNITTDTTLTTSDDVVFVDTTSGNVEVTLPLASAMGGRSITFKLIAGIGTVSIVPQGGEQLDSTSSFSLGFLNQSVSFFSNQSNWYIL